MLFRYLFFFFYCSGCVVLSAAEPVATPIATKGNSLPKISSVMQLAKQSLKKNEQDATDHLGEERAQTIDLPVPVGEEMKGIIIPQYDNSGKLTMNFYASTARKINEHQVELHDLKIEFFEADGKDVTVTVPHGTFDLDTKVLTMNTETKVQREDFNMTGNSGDFDTIKRLGTMKGHVHTEIRNGAPPTE